MPTRSLRDAISTNGGGQQIAPMDLGSGGEYGRNISEQLRGEYIVLPGLQSKNLPGAVLRPAQQLLRMAANNSDVVPGAVMTDPTREEIREEVKDKIAAAEARTDTKIERLGGKIDTLSATLGTKLDIVAKDRNLIIGTIVVSAISIAVLLIGLFTYGNAQFVTGISVRDVVQIVIKEQQEFQKRDTTQQPRH